MLNQNGVQQAYSDFEIDNLHLTAKTTGNPDNLYQLYGVQLNQDDQTLLLKGTTSISATSTNHAPLTYGISLDKDNQRLYLKDSVAIQATTNLTASYAEAYGIFGSQSNQEIAAQNVRVEASAQADQYAYSYGIYDQGNTRNQSRFDDVHIIAKASTRNTDSEVITVGIYPGSSTMEGGNFTIDTLSQAHNDSGEVYSSGIYANARTVMNLQEGNIRATAIGFTNQQIQSFGIYSLGNQQITIDRADIRAITQTQNNDDGWNVGASGIFAQNESAISIWGGSITADLKSDGEWSRAVGVFAENSTIELGSEHHPMTIEANASAGDGYGVEARGHSTIAFYGGKIHGSSFGIQLADSSSMTLTGVAEITADPAKDGYGISLPEVNTKLTLTEGSMVHTNSLASNR